MLPSFVCCTLHCQPKHATVSHWTRMCSCQRDTHSVTNTSSCLLTPDRLLYYPSLYSSISFLYICEIKSVLKELKFMPPVTLVSDPIIRNLKKSSRLELFIALLNNLWTIAMHWSVTDGHSDILTWRYLFFWFRNYSTWQGLNPKIK